MQVNLIEIAISGGDSVDSVTATTGKYSHSHFIHTDAVCRNIVFYCIQKVH
jgi:hypothetical protein